MECKGNKITRRVWNWLDVNEAIINIDDKDINKLENNNIEKEKKQEIKAKEENKENKENKNINLIDEYFKDIEYGVSKEIVRLNRIGNSKYIFLNGEEKYNNILSKIEENKEKQSKYLELYPKTKSGALRLKLKDYEKILLDIHLNENIEATYILELEQVFNLVTRIVLEKNSKLNLILLDRELEKSIEQGNKENNDNKNDEISNKEKYNQNIKNEDKNKQKLESISIIGKETSYANIIKIDFNEYNKYFNYTSDLVEKDAEVNITLAYVLNKKQEYDMSFHQRHIAPNTIGNINVEGVQKDESSKIFKGTLDFKKGSKGSIGNENESVTNYSKNARSVSLPILLAAEDEIRGNHAANHGKFDEEQLYYIQSRGFNKKQAENIIAESKIIPILDQVRSKELKNELKINLKDKLKM